MDNQNPSSQQPVSLPPAEQKTRLFLSKHTIIVIAVMVGIVTIVYLGIYSVLNKQVDQITKPKDQVCIQVIAPARNPQTGECKDFPTPCDVPSGWTKVDSCSQSSDSNLNREPTGSAATANWKTYTNKNLGYEIRYPSDKYMNCGSQNVLELRKTTFCNDGEGVSEIYISVINEKGDYEKSNYPQCYKVRKEEIIVGGIKGIRYTGVQQSDPENKCNTTLIAYSLNNHSDNIILDYNNKIYHIWLPGNAFPEINKEKYEILSTFKFTQ